jgi:hypothetical protein
MVFGVIERRGAGKSEEQTSERPRRGGTSEAFVDPAGACMIAAVPAMVGGVAVVLVRARHHFRVRDGSIRARHREET